MIVRRVSDWPFGNSRAVTSQLNSLLRDLNRLLEQPASTAFLDQSAGVYPLINVTQDSDNYYVRSEIPGVKLENLDVSVTGRSLTIAGEKPSEAEDPKVNYHRKERPSGKFRRQFNLPTDVDADNVKAQYRYGVLMLVLPKAESAKPRRVAISG